MQPPPHDIRPALRWPQSQRVDDDVAIEQPLQIEVDGQPYAVLMRTPGRDLDLVAGLLRAEGLIDGPDDMATLGHIGPPEHRDTVQVILASGVRAHSAEHPLSSRQLVASASCGICGTRSIEDLARNRPRARELRVAAPDWIATLPAMLREHQHGFARTGGLHAAALFCGATWVDTAEDIGRHNAVDKVLGAQLRADRETPRDATLLVSSRAGFEILQKAIMARITTVAAIGAPSTLAIDLARQHGVGLYAFVREGRVTRYA